ncbi:MAG: hypothetical protein LJF15_20650 [Acidobacteria bacterium]|jgi:hypothetical protein|nr:hypothetical protein [Acidobacteriota bacterium]
MSRRPAFSPEGLTLGFGLIAIGVLWTLSNLGQVDLLYTLRVWWPLALILWGGLELVDLAIRRSSSREP